MVKNPLAMQGTWVRSLDWENPLENKMAIYSNILAWKIPWTKELGRVPESNTTEHAYTEDAAQANFAYHAYYN